MILKTEKRSKIRNLEEAVSDQLAGGAAGWRFAGNSKKSLN